MNEKSVIRLLVTFDGPSSSVTVARLPEEWPYTALDPAGLGAEVVVSGRSWGDLTTVLAAAALESQGCADEIQKGQGQ